VLLHWLFWAVLMMVSPMNLFLVSSVKSASTLSLHNTMLAIQNFESESLDVVP
jgi:hypothetical protein